MRSRASWLGLAIMIAGVWGCGRCPDQPICDDNTLVSCEDCSDTSALRCSPRETDCGDNVCVEAQGVASCVDPAMETCTVAYSFVGLACAAENQVLGKSCTRVGYYVIGTRWCDPDQCVEAYGTAGCANPSDPPCDPTIEGGFGTFCAQDGSAVITGTCSEVGYLSGQVSEWCDPSERCSPDVRPGECLVDPLEPCDATYSVWARCEGNVNVFRSCSTSGYTSDEWYDCPSGVCQPEDTGPYGHCTGW
jgi:hypothetical protein